MSADFDPTRGTFSNGPPIEPPTLEELSRIAEEFRAKPVLVRIETSHSGLGLLRLLTPPDPDPVARALGPVLSGYTGVPVVVMADVPLAEARCVFSDGSVRRFDLRTGEEISCSK